MSDGLTHEQEGSPHGDEPPDQEYEGPSFEEIDPSKRYGRVRRHSRRQNSLPFVKFMHLQIPWVTDLSPSFFFHSANLTLDFLLCIFLPTAV